MSNISKVNIAPAATQSNKYVHKYNHFTTGDFGQVNLANSFECLIGDKHNYHYGLFSRVASMVFPTYGDIGVKSICTFVPYYLVADDADSYLSGLTTFGGNIATGRYFTQMTLNGIFLGMQPDVNTDGATWSFKQNGTFNPAFVTPCTADDARMMFKLYDYSTGTLSTTYYRLTAKGKYFYKLLRSLGYNVTKEFYWKLSNGYPLNVPNVSELNSLKLNAYPLLCFLKAYADVLLPTAFYSTSPLVKFLSDVKVKGNDSCDNKGMINIIQLYKALEELTHVYYDSDYFTTAWQSPNSPIQGMSFSQQSFAENQQPFIYSDPTDTTAYLKVQDSADGTASEGRLTARQLQFLGAFDRFIRRNNLVGFKEFNAVYARFGMKPSEFKTNYTTILDVRNVPLQVGDVTNTAESSEAALGSYAGKGIVNDDGFIKLECNDFGMFIHMYYIYVKPVYFQGTRKVCLKTDNYDFYTPEFDGVGPVPISQLELNCNAKDNVYGFTERYNDYRFTLDNITGEFETDKLMYPWHTGRVINNNPRAQTDNMIRYLPDKDGNYEYDRIFAVIDTDETEHYDHFYMQWSFMDSQYRKIKTISDVQNLGVGGLEFGKNGAV